MLETDYSKFLLRLDKKIYIDSHFLLDITNKCKYNCIYCYKKSNSSDILENNEMYLKTEEVIYVTRELSKIGFKIVTISGGEPGLHPNLCEIVKEIKERTKLKIGIFSSYLRTHIIEKIKGNVDLIGISLDGNRKVHNYLRGKNSYHTTMSTIKKLKKYRVPFSIHSTITPINYYYIYDLIKFSKKIGAVSIRLSHVVPSGRGENNNLFLSETQLDKLFELQLLGEKKFGIPIFTSLCDKDFFRDSEKIVTSLIINISFDGSLFPYLALDKKFSIGSFYSGSLNEIISSKNLKLYKFSFLIHSIYKRVIDVLETRKKKIKWIPWEDILVCFLNRPTFIPSYISFFITR